jgi:transcriptional regulator with XRE-family HTH domain
MPRRPTNETSHDVRELGTRIAARRKRLGLSLRDASAETGVSINTLSRVERGHLPDLDNFRKLQTWLGEAQPTASEATSTPDVIGTHLRTDPLLPAEAADKIAAIVKDLYEALSKPPRATPVHLRAARTFTPDAARELGNLLDRMYQRLNAVD